MPGVEYPCINHQRNEKKSIATEYIFKQCSFCRSCVIGKSLIFTIILPNFYNLRHETIFCCKMQRKARSATSTVTLSKNGQQYTLRGIRNRAIQNFYVASNYIYIAQKAGTQLENRNIKRFTYLAYANKSAESFGYLLRMDAALSSDKKTLLIWKRGNGNQEFSGFDFDTFNAVLSASKSNTVSFKGNAKMKKACTFSFNDKNKKLGIPTSVQGLEISDKSNGLHSIYICSGTENNIGGKLSISRFNSAGVKKSTICVSHKLGKNMEIEGIHISGDNLQIGLCSTRSGEKSTQYIFAVPKSKLK